MVLMTKPPMIAAMMGLHGSCSRGAEQESCLKAAMLPALDSGQGSACAVSPTHNRYCGNQSQPSFIAIVAPDVAPRRVMPWDERAHGTTEPGAAFTPLTVPADIAGDLRDMAAIIVNTAHILVPCEWWNPFQTGLMKLVETALSKIQMIEKSGNRTSVELIAKSVVEAWKRDNQVVTRDDSWMRLLQEQVTLVGEKYIGRFARGMENPFGWRRRTYFELRIRLEFLRQLVEQEEKGIVPRELWQLFIENSGGLVQRAYLKPLREHWSDDRPLEEAARSVFTEWSKNRNAVLPHLAYLRYVMLLQNTTGNTRGALQPLGKNSFCKVDASGSSPMSRFQIIEKKKLCPGMDVTVLEENDSLRVAKIKMIMRDGHILCSGSNGGYHPSRISQQQ